MQVYAVVLTIALNLQQFPLFNLPDGQPVYMRTTNFKVAIGQFPTKAECLAYDYSGAEFVFSYTDANNEPQSVAYPLSSLTYSFVGCNKVL